MLATTAATQGLTPVTGWLRLTLAGVTGQEDALYRALFPAAEGSCLMR